MQREFLGEHELNEIVGESPEFRTVLRQATSAAMSQAAVLITGERGTGKELIARAIHRMGHRRKQSFIKLDSATVTPAQFEAAFFGRGVARLEAANSGTLLLTHVESISQDLQPKLLEIFEHKELERSGDATTLPTHASIIATMTDIGKVEDSWFYRNLSQKLDLSIIRVPSLRERRSDIPLLATYFVRKWARSMNRSIDVISNDTMKALENYSWPNNVREVENVIGRLVGSTAGPELHSKTPIGS